MRILVGHEVEDGVNSATYAASEQFRLPRELICSRSSYFRGLLEGGSQAQLCDVRPWVFRVFVGWLYRETIYYDRERVEPTKFGRTRQGDASKLDVANKDEGPSSEEEWETECEEDELNDTDEHDFKHPMTWPHSWLFELYAFADKYRAREFQIDVLEIIQIKLSEDHVVPYPSDVISVVNHIRPSDPLYLLLAQWYSDLNLESVAETMQEQVEILSVLPTRFSMLCHAMFKRKIAAEKCPICGRQGAYRECNAKDHSKEDAIGPHSRDPCFYHDHGGDEKERSRCYWRWFSRKYRICTITFTRRNEC